MTLRKPVLNEDVLDYDTLQTDKINSLINPISVNLEIQSGWVVQSTGVFGVPRAIRSGFEVKLIGLVANGPSGSLVATLPPSMRPLNTIRFKTASLDPLSYVNIEPNGRIMIFSTNTNNVFLTGVNFFVVG